MQRRNRFLLGSLLILFAVGMSACREERPEYPQRPMPVGLMQDEAQLASGHALFMSKCASCHGKPSEGRSGRAVFFDPPAPDFTEPHFQKTDPAYLYWRTAEGKGVEPYLSRGSVMPAWGLHLTEEQIWQLVAYLISRSG